MNKYKHTLLYSCTRTHISHSPAFGFYKKYQKVITAAGLTLILAGCSGDSTPQQPAQEQAALEQSEALSLGAAEANTVQYLDSIAALQDGSSDENGRPLPPSLIPGNQTPVDPAPIILAPIAEVPVNQTPITAPAVESPAVEAAVVETLPVETPTAGSSESQAPAEETPPVDIAVAEIPVEIEPVEIEPVEIEPVAIEPVEIEPVEQTSVAQAPSNETPTTEQPIDELPVVEETTLNRTFTSHIMPSFSGSVKDDGNILVSWEEVSDARGYNLYRDSEYLTTVFDTKFEDVETDNVNSRYYEVESFNEADEYNRFARGLTVELQEQTVELPSHIEDEYDLVFEDNFDGNTLDSSKWNTAYLWGPDLIINQELQYYVDINNQPDFPYNPFKLADGALTIESIPTPDNLLSQANNQPYLSGVITSYDAFKFTYGYAEARVQVPIGRGLWAAFWLLNAYYVDRKPEIDIMEHLGHKLDSLYHTYHYFDSEGQLHSTESESSRGEDFTAGYHTFAVEWRPGTLIYYIDGIERHRVTDPEVSDQDMYIIANTALGGWWPGSPDETTPFPASYKIDYIRAYQKRGLLDDPPQFDDTQTVPLSVDALNPTPNHLPPFELWPDGYPERPPE